MTMPLKVNSVISKAPYGYDVTPDGNLVPLEKDLYLLEEAVKLIDLKALSLREAAAWISSEGSRYISHEGLRKRMLTDIRRDCSGSR